MPRLQRLPIKNRFIRRTNRQFIRQFLKVTMQTPPDLPAQAAALAGLVDTHFSCDGVEFVAVVDALDGGERLRVFLDEDVPHVERVCDFEFACAGVGFVGFVFGAAGFGFGVFAGVFAFGGGFVLGWHCWGGLGGVSEVWWGGDGGGLTLVLVGLRGITILRDVEVRFCLRGVCSQDARLSTVSAGPN